MKKFKFQLETLLKVTKMNKEQAQVELAAATKKLEEARAHLVELLEQMAQGHKDYDALTSKGTITLGTLMTYNSFFNWKREQIEHQQHYIMECQSERTKRMQELVKIMNKLKSIEQLKEKRYQQYMAEVLFEEQKLLDEIGGQLYFRNMG
ncbi:MAG: flagellar export protein FliJ [Anaerovibrio sp.]|uniref:flagellar export protein FliJ n=1 Tax=Anaerovibrio sp. TaxID=1872532 RepID=UPI0025DB2750|nr:flagellar export protein FliJ [Anaerovibrio sp.]MCR5175904.1 flagellar export protein FliJ [Anaerovibrio sp.]